MVARVLDGKRIADEVLNGIAGRVRARIADQRGVWLDDRSSTLCRQEGTRPVFRALKTLARRQGLSGLSMGMTNDFEVAIEEGATHVRVGRALFGERP